MLVHPWDAPVDESEWLLGAGVLPLRRPAVGGAGGRLAGGGADPVRVPGRDESCCTWPGRTRSGRALDENDRCGADGGRGLGVHPELVEGGRREDPRMGIPTTYYGAVWCGPGRGRRRPEGGRRDAAHPARAVEPGTDSSTRSSTASPSGRSAACPARHQVRAKFKSAATSTRPTAGRGGGPPGGARRTRRRCRPGPPAPPPSVRLSALLATHTGRGGSGLAYDVARGLVRPQPAPDRVAEPAVAGPLAERTSPTSSG